MRKLWSYVISWLDQVIPTWSSRYDTGPLRSPLVPSSKLPKAHRTSS
jgi:hypothetical protein